MGAISYNAMTWQHRGMRRIWCLLCVLLLPAISSSDLEDNEERVKKELYANVDLTYDHEMSMIPQSGPQIQMTVPQRLVWQRAFQAARKAGASVHEAQVVALRSAADGRVQPYVGDGEGREKTMCCTACQLEMPRSDISTHYKTSWHAFNTERKVLGLMPLPLAAFEQRVRSIEEGERGKEAKEKNALQSEKIRNELRHASKKNTKLAADIPRLYCLNQTDHNVQEKIVFLEMRKLQAERLLDMKLGGLRSLEQNCTEDGGPDKADKGRRTGKKVSEATWPQASLR